MNLRFRSKTQRQKSMLVSGRHVAAHSDGHQQFEQFWFLFLMMNGKNHQYLWILKN